MRLLLFLLLALCETALFAQSGTLQGIVKDPSGGSVANAVVAASTAGKTVRAARSDAQGRYQLTGLPAGTYVLRVTTPGFASFELSGYVLSRPSQIFDIALTLQANSEQVTVTDTIKVDVDPSNNAGALVLNKAEMDALPDDPDDLATDLQALAGAAAGPNGGQIYIDGFTGGRLPPKQSIREIRINQNPFAAQFDKPGQGRIEIFTKPGTDEFHGELLFQFSDASFNSRNPFVAGKPPYRRRQWEGETSGPLGKKTSFFFDFERRDIDENAFVSAFTLDPAFNVVPFSQAVVTPLTGVEMNFKIDRQLTKNHSLTARYTYARDSRDNQGVGGFTLASRGYNVLGSEDTLQLAETGILNIHTVNETRFRYRRQTADERGGSTAPATTVLDAFSEGGSPLGISYNRQNRFELQNFTSSISGKHTLRFGGLMRGVTLTDQSMQNYSGTFTFTSLASYRQTLLGLQQGLTPGQIRALGGGASQFTLSTGDPLASLNQFDFGLFAQDDWRAAPNLTLSGGLRYEAQTHSRNHSDMGPRLGLAWAVGKSKTAPKNVIRAGFGIFYERLNESLTLDALRQDGIRQPQYLVPSPDFYPAIPSPASLGSAAGLITIRRTDANWQPPVLTQMAVSYERQLPKGITVTSNYIHTIGTHALRSRDINAPLPGSGIYPYGGANGIYLYESSGVYRQNQLITNVNARLSSKMTFSGFYAFGHAWSNTDGAGTFPANQYDLATEYGRAGYDIRHRLQLNGSLTAKWGIRVSPFVTITSGRPYNITVGKDLNGDGLYTDRPAFATDPARASVVHTPLGVFDLSPIPGQRIVPRNYADGPGVLSANMRVSKVFTFGESDAKSSDPKQLTFTVNARNVLNHPNLASPDGNLSSPLFGRSNGLLNGQGINGNRRIDLQIKFGF